jgi:hypothetical protein
MVAVFEKQECQVHFEEVLGVLRDELMVFEHAAARFGLLDKQVPRRLETFRRVIVGLRDAIAACALEGLGLSAVCTGEESNLHEALYAQELPYEWRIRCGRIAQTFNIAGKALHRCARGVCKPELFYEQMRTRTRLPDVETLMASH